MPLSSVALSLGMVLLPQVQVPERLSGRPPNLDQHGGGRPPTTGAPTGTKTLRPPTPPDGDDTQVSSPNSGDQDECPICVDPTDRLHLVGAANDDRAGPFNCAFYSSFDGGLTWGEMFFSDGGANTACDPAVAIGPTGETYFEALSLSNSGIYVGRSNDGGVTVPSWVELTQSTVNYSDDKPQMVVDTTTGSLSGAVYVTWTRFRANGSFPIMMSASFDGGGTWSTAQRLSDSPYCQGSCPAVGPNGELYVAFYDYNDATIKFDQSPDGGVTWGTDVKIDDATYLGSVPNTFFRTNSFPAVGVDRSGGPYHGHIYVVWATDKGTSSGPDVFLSKSTDGGATFSTPIVASDVDTNSQFDPWIAVDSNGNVNVGFYDRRKDPNDTRINYYVSRSSDGGATFQPNVKVSDKGFNPNNYPQGGFIGDYTGICASDRTIHPIWTDGRNGDNDIFTSRVQLDIHTDVANFSAATGGTVNFTLDPGPLYQNDAYRILGSISGTSPGITLHGVNVPVNYDAFTLLTILDANTSALPGFAGTLDVNGMATASLVSGPLPASAVGVQFDFAAFVKAGTAVRWASNPTHLEIVP
jgi:hypothetical protein